MNASRNGSAARASRKRQIGKRGAGGEAWRALQADAAVIGKWDGRRHIVVLCASERRHFAIAKLLACGSEYPAEFGGSR